MEHVSRQLSQILDKGLDERIEKEFLSTQEETLTSIPEDPETEAELVDELPTDESKCDESGQLSSATLASSVTAAQSVCSAETNLDRSTETITNVAFEQNDYENGSLAVGNGPACLIDDDDNNNNNDKVSGIEGKIDSEEEYRPASDPFQNNNVSGTYSNNH